MRNSFFDFPQDFHQHQGAAELQRAAGGGAVKMTMSMRRFVFRMFLCDNLNCPEKENYFLIFFGSTNVKVFCLKEFPDMNRLFSGPVYLIAVVFPRCRCGLSINFKYFNPLIKTRNLKMIHFIYIYKETSK